jgi:hypothetical protein
MAVLKPGQSVTQTFNLGKIPAQQNYAGEKLTAEVTITRNDKTRNVTIPKEEINKKSN